MSSSTTNFHLEAGDTVEINVRANEHEHSRGPYAVVTLELGSHSLTIFPKGTEQVAALAASLRAGAEVLEALKLGAEFATVLTE